MGGAIARPSRVKRIVSTLADQAAGEQLSQDPVNHTRASPRKLPLCQLPHRAGGPTALDIEDPQDTDLEVGELLAADQLLDASIEAGGLLLWLIRQAVCRFGSSGEDSQAGQP